MKSLLRCLLIAMLSLPCAALGQTTLPFVVDSTGKAVGQLLSPGTVLLDYKGQLSYAYFDRDGFAFNQAQNHFLYYTTPDCTGEAYVYASAEPPNAFIFQDRKRLAVPDSPAAPVTVMGIRVPEGTGIPPAKCRGLSAVGIYAYHVKIFTDLSKLGVPPFSARMLK